ncbi:MAG TPA: hypothetical protein VIH57_17800 [Bacteroidales bacterium]
MDVYVGTPTKILKQVINSLGVMQFGFNLGIKLVLTAIIPISALIIVSHNKMLRSHLKLADELSKKLKENKSIQDKIVDYQLQK